MRRLTPVSGQINEIAASPDGSTIAYDAERYVYGKDPHVTGDDVHLMDADGAHNRTVYSCPSSTCFSLQWSPAGGRLLINGNVVLEPNGRVVKLCQGGCGSGYPLEAGSWSPDGQHLVFEDSVTVQQQEGTSTVSAIATADADGGHVRLITNRRCTTASKAACTYDSAPAWSPSGRQIGFVRLVPTFLRLDQSLGLGPIGPTGVYTVRPDGTNITRTSSCGTQCGITSLDWDPLGNRLAAVRTPFSIKDNAATNSIVIADPTTGSTNDLTLRTQVSQPDEEWIAPAIAWAPSGQHIAVVAHRPGKPTALYSVPIHKTTLGSLTPVVDGAYPPVIWTPAAT